MRYHPNGFTLYELLLTMTLLAIIAGLALPSFEKIIANGRLRTEVDALFHAIHLARQESVVRRQVVSICPSLDGTSCTASLDWSDGWIMFNNLDRDDPPGRDPGEALLQAHRTDSAVRISANRRGFTLRSTELRATNGTIVVCDPAGRVTPRALVVSYTGRPRVTLADTRGNPYRCAD